MALRFATCFVLLLGLCACLENEEEITIHADGSSTIEIVAKGQAADLIDGYVLPFGPAWSACRPELGALVPDLNAADATQQLQRGLRALAAAPTQNGNPQPDVELGVRASFARVEDWPRCFAPASEPYPAAYLERGASLKIDEKRGRQVFVFERTYHARSFERYDVLGLVEHEVPEELLAKEKRDELLSDAEREQLAQALRSALVRTALAFADDALLSSFVQGDAALAPSALEGTRAQISAALEQLATPAKVRDLVDRLVSDDKESEHTAAQALEDLEQATRDALRNALESALRGVGLAVPTRNAIRGELEGLLAAYDATSDLDDESFKVSVHMPGIVVGGNFDERDAERVTWKFEGKSLHDRTRVLRVVSVIDHGRPGER